MRDVLISLALVLAVAFPAAAETRALSSFSAIRINQGVELEVNQGDAYAVVVDGPDADRIVTTVSGGTLTITRRGFFHFGVGPEAQVRVTMPRLAALRAASGVQVTLGPMQAQRLGIELSQGAELQARALNVTDLHLSASQGATATLGGECGALTVRASMGGDITAENLRCSSAVAHASMGGNVDLRAGESVAADASMGGMIDVSGQPTRREVSTGMGGAVDFN